MSEQAAQAPKTIAPTTLAPPTPAGAIELTVIAPTYNERANVAALVEKLDAALAGVRWEVIFVDDDSPDGTSAAVKAIAQRDPRVRCLRRVGRRGLAGAAIEGALASAAPYVALIDADMQHDETMLPRMLDLLRAGDCDIVPGTRYLDDAGLREGFSPIRKWGSQTATAFARRVLGVEASDLMGGFFMVRREVVERVAPKLLPSGFKLLLDILASQPEKLRIKEVAYAFRDRAAGESKMDVRVVVEYAGLVGAKLTGDLIPPLLPLYALIGGAGLLVQVAAVLATGGLALAPADAIGAGVGVLAAGVAADILAHGARRRKGLRLLARLVGFAILAAPGIAGNLAIAVALSDADAPKLAAISAGALLGAIWNAVVAYFLF
jgi:dolichol-phosphate mannosyltransferase